MPEFRIIVAPLRVSHGQLPRRNPAFGMKVRDAKNCMPPPGNCELLLVAPLSPLKQELRQECSCPQNFWKDFSAPLTPQSTSWWVRRAKTWNDPKARHKSPQDPIFLNDAATFPERVRPQKLQNKSLILQCCLDLDQPIQVPNPTH